MSQRKSLAGLFEGLDIHTKRPVKPLPEPPGRERVLNHKPSSNLEDHLVRRMCMPTASYVQLRFKEGWTVQETKDNYGLSEKMLQGPDGTQTQCCAGPNTIQCCSLCDPQKWIFQGSEYDPTFSLLYARKDGCIGSYVKLQDPKFIIPWRYKNRKTSAISWKIIHQCGTQVKDAESETIVVNVERDTNLVKWIQMAKQHAKIYQDADLVEALLLLIHQALGSYGLPRGATSADADASLYRQMKKQGHNFMMLGQVKIGLCRHKALLFKILCDAVDLECALVTGYSTGGRHQWNLITLADKESYIIDPTSPHFTWTKQGSLRTKAYRVSADTSFGHGGLTMKMNGIL